MDDDEIGVIDNDLQRRGWTHGLGIKYNLTLSPGTTVNLEFSYTYVN